jgi:hypothetical protein
MAQQKKGKGVAVVLSLVAIAGVIGYVLYRRYKNKNQKRTDATPSFDVAPKNGGGSTNSGGSTSSGNPFGNKNDLLKFQKWVIISKGDKTILGKGGSTGFGDDGQWGSKSASAWAKYGGGYNASVVKDDGTTISTPLPSYLLPNPSGTGTTSNLKKVVSTSYVNYYLTPSSFLPFNTLPYAPNQNIGTSDGVLTYDGNTPYYKVNIPQSLQQTSNIPTGNAYGYVKANYVKLS